MKEREAPHRGEEFRPTKEQLKVIENVLAKAGITKEDLRKQWEEASEYFRDHPVGRGYETFLEMGE